MNRVKALFHRLRAQSRCGLIAYVTCGDGPTADIILALAEAGADAIELGVPFSDPIADGPVIQRAGYRALEAGATVARVLDIAREIRCRSEVPLLLFTYLNPILHYGLDKLARDAKTAGIDGCLLTDASVEEAESYVKVMRAAGLDTVFLAAPTSTERRMKLVAGYSTGFVYLVSRTGVTGQRDTLSSSVEPLVQAMRRVTSLPLAVGFGISQPEHVAEAARLADGVVVGSAIVSLIERNAQNASLEIQLESFIRELKRGLDTARA